MSTCDLDLEVRRSEKVATNIGTKCELVPESPSTPKECRDNDLSDNLNVASKLATFCRNLRGPHHTVHKTPVLTADNATESQKVDSHTQLSPNGRLSIPTPIFHFQTNVNSMIPTTNNLQPISNIKSTSNTNKFNNNNNSYCDLPPKPITRNKFSLPTGLPFGKSPKSYAQTSSSSSSMTFCSTRYANNFNNIITAAATTTHSLPSGLNPALFYTNYVTSYRGQSYDPTLRRADPQVDPEGVLNHRNTRLDHNHNNEPLEKTNSDSNNKINPKLLSRTVNNTNAFPKNKINDGCTPIRMPCKQCQCIIAVDAIRIQQLRQQYDGTNATSNISSSTRKLPDDSSNLQSPYPNCPSTEDPPIHNSAHLEPSPQSASLAKISPGQHHRRQPSHGSSSGYSSNDSTLLFHFKQHQSNGTNGEVRGKVTNGGWKIDDLWPTRKPLFSWKFNLHKETSAAPFCPNTNHVNNLVFDNTNNNVKKSPKSLAHKRPTSDKFVMTFEHSLTPNNDSSDPQNLCLDPSPDKINLNKPSIPGIEPREEVTFTGDEDCIAPVPLSEDLSTGFTEQSTSPASCDTKPNLTTSPPPSVPVEEMQHTSSVTSYPISLNNTENSPTVVHDADNLGDLNVMDTPTKSKDFHFSGVELLSSPNVLSDVAVTDGNKPETDNSVTTFNTETTQESEYLNPKLNQDTSNNKISLIETLNNNNNNIDDISIDVKSKSSETVQQINEFKTISLHLKNISTEKFISPEPRPSNKPASHQSCPCLCHELCSFGLLVPVECFAPYITFLDHSDSFVHGADTSPDFYVYDPDGDQIHPSPQGSESIHEIGGGGLNLPLTLSSPPSTASTLSSLESSSYGSILNNNNYENDPKHLKNCSEARHSPNTACCQQTSPLTISGSVTAMKLKWNKRAVANFLIPRKFLNSTAASNMTALPRESNYVSTSNSTHFDSLSVKSSASGNGFGGTNPKSSVNANDNRVGMPLLIMENRPGNLPPKNPCEELKHRTLYNQLIEASKKKEANEFKLHKKMERERLLSEKKLAQILAIWNTEIFPHWETMKNTKKTFQLWGLGLPPSIRGKVWYLALTESQNTSDIEEKRLILSSLDYLFPDCCDNQTLTKNFASTHTKYAKNHLSDEDEPTKNSESNGSNNIPGTNSGTNSFDFAPLHSELCSTKNSLGPTLDRTLSTINLDVSRTFPHLCIFQQAGPYHERLKKLLLAYSIYNPQIGYVQGMSFIGAILLLNMELEDAFTSFCNILELPCFQTFYTLDQINMKRYFDLYSEFLEVNLPDLYDHFLALNFTPDLYLTDWIYTIYSKSLHLDVTCRIWDLFLREGETYLFKTALGILKLHEDVLLKMDFMQSAQLLTKLPENLSIDQLFKTISKIVI